MRGGIIQALKADGTVATLAATDVGELKVDAGDSDLASALVIALQPLLLEMRAIRIGIQLLVEDQLGGDDLYDLAVENELTEGE